MDNIKESIIIIWIWTDGHTIYHALEQKKIQNSLEAAKMTTTTSAATTRGIYYISIIEFTPIMSPSTLHMVESTEPINVGMNSTDCDNDGRKPESFFVFIVGVCGEWENGRAEYGDIGLYNAHIYVGIPIKQIVYLKDKDATKSNCEEQLMKFLKTTVPNSTLIFFYGGHGGPLGFQTLKDSWPYQDVVKSIDASFAGDRVVILADCCASGNLSRWIQPPYRLRHSYVCLMSSPPFREASSEWVMTICWINALQRNNGALSLSTIISYMADETTRIKGDLLAVSCCGKDASPKNCTWLPSLSPEKVKGKLEWKNPIEDLPDEAKVGSDCTIGDRVFYRHHGGRLTPGSTETLMPIWLEATVQSRAKDGRLQIKVKDFNTHIETQMVVSPTKLLSEWQMWSTFVLPDRFDDAECALARLCRYIDYSVPPSTPVTVRWSDGILYDALTMDWREVDWEDYLESGSCKENGPTGPYIPVRWLEEKSFSIVSLGHVEFPLSLQVSINSNSANESSETEDVLPGQREALLKGLQTCGKFICDANKVFGTSKLAGIWPEEDEWYDVVALGPAEISLETLASHAWFTAKGEYCPVRFCDDNETLLLPLKLVKRRENDSWLCCC